MIEEPDGVAVTTTVCGCSINDYDSIGSAIPLPCAKSADAPTA
jgi:hypothetical protein